MAWLVALSGEMATKRIVVRSPCLIGRGPYNHLVLEETRISRQHAKITPELGGFFVYDLNSANGTFVNEQQVRRHRLQQGEVLRVGPFQFRFELAPDEMVAAASEVGRADVTIVGDAEDRIVETLEASAVTGPDLTSNLLQLEDAERKLQTIYSLMQAIATRIDQSQLIECVVYQLLEVFPTATLAAVYLRDAASGPMEPWLIVRRDGSVVAGTPLAAQFFDDVVDRGLAILSAPRDGGARRGIKTGLSMHAPMIYGRTTYGVLHVQGPDEDGGELPYRQGDLDLLNGIALQTAMALQNVRMHQESLKQVRMQQDLQLAEEIQKSFLPRALPNVPGIKFVTDYRPAYSVGGDFYDIFWVAEGLLGILIGDVAGKGVSAALHMARVSSDFRIVAQSEREPAAVMTRVNQVLLDREQDEMFVTAIYMTLDTKTRRVKLASAGHLPPFVRRRLPGVIQKIEGGVGTALGIVADADYSQVEVTLDAGDSLVLYTDGVIEATSPGGEQFNFARLEASLAQKDSAPDAIAKRLFADLDAHVRKAAQYDDLTLIICGVL